MSEITKIGRAMEGITPIVMNISNTRTYTASTLKELQDILKKLHDYRTTCDHALKKIDEKDPVTQAPRYGPNMIQKIHALDQNLNTVLELADVLLMENISAVKKATEEAEEARASLEAEKLRTQLNQGEEIPRDIEEEKVSSVDLEKLNAQAEEIRQKKRQQAILEKTQTENDFYNLITAIEVLNLSWYRSLPDRQTTLSAIRQLKNGTSSDHFMRVSEFLNDLLEKVSRRPDDEKLRRIRINHQVIQSLFGEAWYQCVCLMLTIGFACKPVLSSGEMIPPFPPQEERQLSSEESLEIITRMLFHEQSTYTLLLEMSEPAIVAGESYQWIRWFDGLKESMFLLVEGMMSS